MVMTKPAINGANIPTDRYRFIPIAILCYSIKVTDIFTGGRILKKKRYHYIAINKAIPQHKDPTNEHHQ